MAGHITTVTKEYIYDGLFKAAPFNLGSPLYIGLSTTTPEEDGSNFTEPVGNGYAKVIMQPADWTEANYLGEGSNLSVISFPAATGEWGIITYAGVFVDPPDPAGIRLFYELSEAIYVVSGVVVEFNTGDFIFGPWALP